VTRPHPARPEDRQITVSIEPLAARLERALARFRVQAAHNLLDEAFAAAPADVVARELVLPLYERLEATGDPGVTRFAASVFEIRLLVQARGWERIDAPSVTLACAPREQRTLALIALGLGLAARHCRIAYLGGSTPTAALHGLLIVVHADADDLEPAEREDLRALGVVLAGSAAAPLGDALGLVALPTDVTAATETAAALAHRRSPQAGDAP
jgi:hypothetical protein